MNFPKDIMYTASHEWVRLNDDRTALVGISDYAQNELGDLVFVNLPEVDDTVVCGEAFADVESVKAVSDIYSPLSGRVTEINEALLDEPQLINEAPYDSWLIKVTDISDKAALMGSDEYAAHVSKEA